MTLLNDRYVERVARTRSAVPEAFLKKMDDILRLTGGYLRVPTTGGTGKPLVVDSSERTNASDVAGWQPSMAGSQSTPSSTAKTPTPEVWLDALASGRDSIPPPEMQGHPSFSTANGGEIQAFKSMLQLVPTVCTSAAQKLDTVFDGGVYTGRPVGSC